jgi:hypothetical protein
MSDTNFVVKPSFYGKFLEVELEEPIKEERMIKYITFNVKRKYQFVPKEKKKQLLSIIINQEETIKSASKKVDINYSTAKHIYQ